MSHVTELSYYEYPSFNHPDSKKNDEYFFVTGIIF